MAELDQTTTTTTTTTTPTTTSSQQKPIEALTTEVQWLETQLSNNTPVDQLQSHWTAFSQKLAKQSPDAGQYLDTINEIVSRFSSPQEWKQLVNTLKKKVEQSQPLSTATQAAHQNQATW
ncbi:hypothetical protein DFQ28_005373 [Apophysomyces sp. BC1034]|nr:hypothetical protein DFQ28_005373 [Apophysomyces sp. BC1034]